MSEEEKEAIEYIKNLWLDEYEWAVDIDDTTCEANVEKLDKAVDTTLNYIDKLQKEVHEKNSTIIELNNLIAENIDNSISKDKIRDKIKELEETTTEELRYDFLMNRDEVKRAVIKVLEELLN